MSDAMEAPGYIDHPYLVEESLEDRSYQRELADSALSQSSLVVLPTGTGKTPVAMMVTADRLNDHRGKRALLLAPTKPLVEQHTNEFQRVLDIPDAEIKMFTGDTRPDDREDLWNQPASVVIATPQVIENDLIAGRISFEDVVHLVFDECHRGTGDYSYTYIAERYWQHHEEGDKGLVTGLSASPGSDEEQILDVCENLGIRNIEVVTEDDDGLDQYQAETTVQTEQIELVDEYAEIVDVLDDPYTEVLKRLKNDFGVLDTRSKSKMSQKRLGAARGKASEMADNDNSKGYKAMSYISEARKFMDARNAIQTQGLAEFKRKLDKWEQEADAGKSKAVQRFLNRPEVERAQRLANSIDSPHPKMKAVRSEVVMNHMNDGQAIIFTDSRRMAARLADFLTFEDIVAERFVGQSNRDGDKGLSQSEQSALIEDFRAGDVDVLVATSVAEEGLDIPSVDLVLFYEPVASEIRAVQRRGRTGRQSDGRVLVLMTKGSRDEGAYWAAKRREKGMKNDLKALRDASDDLNERLGASQVDLGTFVSADETGDETDASDDEGAVVTAPTADDLEQTRDDVASDEGSDDVIGMADVADSNSLQIVVDQRETKSAVVKRLSKNPDVDVSLETLEIGDYVVSERCAVERKSVADFHATIGGHDDRSLFEQLIELANEYERGVLLIEGDMEELYTGSGIHPNAIRGMLAAVALSFSNLTILNTLGEEDTADMLEVLASREQEENDREVSSHGSKSTKSMPEQQEYVVSSIVDVGPVTAKALLEEFGSVRAVLTAERSALMQVENVGEATAQQVIDVVTAEYSG